MNLFFTRQFYSVSENLFHLAVGLESLKCWTIGQRDGFLLLLLVTAIVIAV